MVAVRLELRVPSPHSFPRSGALIFDFHNIEFWDGLQKVSRHPHFTSPALDHSPDSTTVDGQPLFRVECGQIGVALSLVGQATATVFLSLGSLSDLDVLVSDYRPPLQPRVSVTKSQANAGVITALTLELPSAHIVIHKDLLDAVQYFVDDTSQLFERFSQRVSKPSADAGEGEDVSLIGSHFFSRSGANSTSAMMNSTPSNSSESVFKAIISEGMSD
jgi:autophagy-related protein 2